MTTAKRFRIYEVLGRHFGNTEDAKIVVTEIEQIIETKLDREKDVLATKADLLKMQIEIEKRFNQLTIWIVGSLVAISSIVIAVIKL